MSYILSRKLAVFPQKFTEQLNKPNMKTQLSQFSIRSFIATDKAQKFILQSSYMLDHQNVKQLERIEKMTKQLKQKQKRQRSYLKRLKKMYQRQLKQFQDLQRIAERVLLQRNKQIEFLTMENTGLKEQIIQLFTLREQREIINSKNQRLQYQNKALSQQLSKIQDSFQGFKVKFQQQSDLLAKGIRQNQTQTEPTALQFFTGSLLDVRTLTNDQKEQIINQNDQASQKSNQNLRVQNQQISNCNYMLQSLLKQIENTNNQESKENVKIEDQIQNSQMKLASLVDQLMRKTEKLSEVLRNSNELERHMQKREDEIKHLNINLKQQQRLCNQKQQKYISCKQQLQAYKDQQKSKEGAQRQNNQRQVTATQQFKDKLIKLLQDKKLKQHSLISQIFLSTVADIFKTYYNNGNSQRFMQTVLKTVEANLIELNDYLGQKAEQDNQRIQKMVGLMNNANEIIRNNEQTEEQYIEQKDFNIYSPQRSNLASAFIHRRQPSNSSARSKKKSMALEDDLDSGVNMGQQTDMIREDNFQKYFADQKPSQQMLDSLVEGDESQQSSRIRDVSSPSALNKSESENQKEHQKQQHTNLNNFKLKAKLKKKVK